MIVFDYRVADVFVPASHAIAAGQAPVQTGALYALPRHTILGLAIAAVPLGIARAALDAVKEILGKTPRIRLDHLGDRPLVHAALR